jgi:hypothetical protein
MIQIQVNIPVVETSSRHKACPIDTFGIDDIIILKKKIKSLYSGWIQSQLTEENIGHIISNVFFVQLTFGPLCIVLIVNLIL